MKAQVRDESGFYEQIGVEAPEDHSVAVFHPRTFLVGAFQELDPAYHFTTERRTLQCEPCVDVCSAGSMEGS